MARLRTRKETYVVESEDRGFLVSPLPATRRMVLSEQRVKDELTPEGELRPRVDRVGLNADLFVETVEAWWDLADETRQTLPLGSDDQPLQCTPENRRLVAEWEPGLVQEVLAKAESRKAVREGAARGNFETTPPTS